MFRYSARPSLLIAGSLILALGLFACAGNQSPQTTLEHEHDHAHEDHGGSTGHAHAETAMPGHDHAHGDMTHVHGETTTTTGFVTVRDLRFRLAPDFGKDNVTHLDLYIQDEEGHPVPGAEATLVLTTPGGEKQELPLKEDTKGRHYHTKVVLTGVGEYNAVALVRIKDTKYNPRFSFPHQP